MVARRYHGMTKVQGRIWNCLVDHDWLTLNDINQRCGLVIHSNQVQFMCSKYGVMQRKINLRLFFKLPELGNA